MLPKGAMWLFSLAKRVRKSALEKVLCLSLMERMGSRLLHVREPIISEYLEREKVLLCLVQDLFA